MANVIADLEREEVRERIGDGGRGTEAGDQGRDGARVAASGLLRHGQERVGRPRHGGDDHDGRLGAMAANDLDGGGIGQRRTAELVHLRCSAGSGHETI